MLLPAVLRHNSCHVCAYVAHRLATLLHILQVHEHCGYPVPAVACVDIVEEEVTARQSNIWQQFGRRLCSPQVELSDGQSLARGQSSCCASRCLSPHSTSFSTAHVPLQAPAPHSLVPVILLAAAVLEHLQALAVAHGQKRPPGDALLNGCSRATGGGHAKLGQC